MYLSMIFCSFCWFGVASWVGACFKQQEYRLSRDITVRMSSWCFPELSGYLGDQRTLIWRAVCDVGSPQVVTVEKESVRIH